MRLKYLSLNIWQGGKLFNNIQKFIFEEDADIVALQEVYIPIDQPDQLTEQFKYNYTSFAPTYSTNINGSKLMHGNAILSKFPITPIEVVFYDLQYVENFIEPLSDFSTCPRNLQHVQIKINSQRINVFNTHGIWQLHNDDNDRRLNMSNIIINKTNNLDNVILSGDFNVDMKSMTMQNIAKNLNSNFDNLDTSFNLKYKDNPLFYNLVVDNIFTSKNLNVVKAYTSEADISDHKPLIIKIEV